MKPIYIVVLVVLNLGFLIWYWISTVHKPLSGEILLNGQKYRYLYPRPVRYGLHKGKYTTPYVDKFGKNRLMWFVDPQDHIRSLISTMKKHPQVMAEMVNSGRMIPC